MSKYIDRQWLFLFVLVVAVTLLRLPALSQPFDNDSGANAYHARLILRGEPLYSTHHPAHHLPGVYYTYTLAFLMFGDSTWSVKILLIPWTIVIAYLIYVIGLRLAREYVGILASIFYILLNSHEYLKGDTAETELFANLPIVAAILLAIELILRNTKNWFFIFVGIISSFAFLYKAVFLTPVAVTILMILFNAWIFPDKRESFKIAIKRILWIGIGFLIPALLLMGIYYRMDLLSRFLMVFSIGNEYVNQLSQNKGFIYTILLPLTVLALNNPVLLLLSFGGVLHIVMDIHYKIRITMRLNFIAYGIIFWFIFSIIVAGITKTGWFHYHIIVIPPLSILAGWEIYQIYLAALKRKKKSLRYSITLITLIIAVVLSWSLITNYQQHFHYILYKLNIESYEKFLSKGGNPETNTATNILKVSEYIRSNTNLEDKIYSWSDYAQIYYLADRRAPIDIIWPSYVEATGPYKRIFSPETKYIIIGNSIVVSQPYWLFEELEKSYYLEIEIGDFDLYHRIDY